jgi:predicted nucleotidyltransferase
MAMYALSSYSLDAHADVGPALQELDDPLSGLSALSSFSERTAFALFDWPDWPGSKKNAIQAQVDEFRRRRIELDTVAEGTPEWRFAFQDSRPDPESATIIGERFVKRFGNRVQWVKSERDSRGRIMASCMVEDLVQIPQPRSTMLRIAQESAKYRAERFPWVSLKLSWKNSRAIPPGPLSEADRLALQACTQEISDWAASRIQPILDALHDKLKALYGERFRGLYVFGSYARPDAGIELSEDSDLDVALILSDFTNAYEEIKRFGDVTYDLSLEHGIVISLVPIREADYREGRTNFTRVISSYAIPAK